MKEFLTFDDVLIVPQFSNISSRKDVNLYSNLNGLQLKLPIISANMDTVTEAKMALAMYEAGGIGCLHRFSGSSYTQAMFQQSNNNAIISFGLGENERNRVRSLNGAKYFCLDVAHGAQEQVVEQVRWFKREYPLYWLMVGNFASSSSLQIFLKECGHYRPEAVKVGIGGGSACTTRVKTGIGIPQVNAVMECSAIAKLYKISVVSDGGHRTSGDIAKALASGADAVMLGGMLAGTDETPAAQKIQTGGDMVQGLHYVQYRGSASKESYEDQNKDWATAEGESFTVPYKGSVANVLAEIKGGLQSTFTYVGARNLKEFKEKAQFIKVTSNGVKEGTAHGKRS